MRKFPEKLAFLEKCISPEPVEMIKRFSPDRMFNQHITLYTNHKNFPVIVFAGAGKVNEWDLEKARQLWGGYIKTAYEMRKEHLAVYWDSDYPVPGLFSIFIKEVISALYMAAFTFTKFRAERSEIPPEITEVFFFYPGADKKVEEALEEGKIIGESVNFSRELAETPSNIMTPEKFVSEVKQLEKEFKLKMEILNRTTLRAKKLNALLAVAQGSDNPPFLVIADYHPDSARKTLAFVGKGVTFDTGGISLKPSKNMEEMKYDMSGAAVVLGAIKAIAGTALPVRILAVMPLVENMPSGKAIRPGDIITSYSGKTIEILNTDAEGRLILADALSYVEKNYHPDIIIDLATLTGAVVVALGHIAAAVLSDDTNLLETLQEASRMSGEKIWEFPLWSDYKEMMKSRIADIPNISQKSGAGAITAAIFLKNFIEKTPWAHLDIAGTAYGMPEKSYRSEGATGFGVKLLWYFTRLMSTTSPE
ncbi:MAG: leucyl aminopeptidase [Calditrichaeota bacterium]|nr:MAG: leucyl aminopeptidase [Calditrichota bacterium]